MAIDYAKISSQSRGKGHSVVAAAAYRAAEDLYCEYTGRRHDYTNRSGVQETFIVAPAGAEWTQDRSRLWNAVEAKERRNDARTGREVLVALPAELTEAQRSKLTRDFARALVERYGVAVDVAIHAPSAHGDQRNHHAHLLMTTRQVSAEGLGAKSELELQNKWLIANGRPTTQEQFREVRALWEHTANVALARAGHDERIDMRSYAARGIDLKSTVHMGRVATAIMRRGGETGMAEIAREARAASADILRISPEKAIAVVEREKSVFDRRDVARVVHRFVEDPVLFQSILERALAHESVVALAPEFRDPVSGKVVQQARFATKAMVRIEHKMVSTAVALAERGGFKTDEARVGERLSRFEKERGFGLNAEQQDAVRHVTQDRAIAAIVGLAGTGKSTMLEVARQVWEGEGHRVFGAALAGKAAEELIKSSGIEARTLASWELRWQSGREPWREGDVFVVDEAGMVSSRQLARIVEIVKSAKAKLVLVGDPQQLQPIQAGAAFRAIVEKTGYLELGDIRRQKEEWQRAASVEFARGNIAAAIGAYESRGLVTATATLDEARERVVRDWFAGRTGAETEALILAYRNKDVDAMNASVRTKLRERGELGEEHSYETVQRRTKPLDHIEMQETKGKEQVVLAFAVGDRVLFRENQGVIKNGMLGSVIAARPGEIDVKLDHGVRVSVSSATYKAVSHGYATTIHKAQGATVDRSYFLASPIDDRHLGYVAMTRHREEAKLYYATEEFKNQTLVEGLSRSRAKEATTDYHVDIDAFLERRGLESRRSFADQWATYVESTRAWIHERRERFEGVWQRFEVLIGRRQAQASQASTSSIEPLFRADAGPSATPGVNHRIQVPGLSAATLAALGDVSQALAARPAAARQSVSKALANPDVAKEVGAVAVGIEQRFGPWRLGLGLQIDAPEAKLAERYGEHDARTIARNREVLRALHIVHDQAREQRSEILAHEKPSAEQTAKATEARPLVTAAREFPQTVERVAREQTAAHVYYLNGLAELRQVARSAVRQPDKIVAAIDEHIRAHAGEKDAPELARRFVVQNGERLGGGLLGSTKLLDFEGKKERRRALQAFDALGDHAGYKARHFSDQLEKNRETEQQRRAAMAIEIPALSKSAESAIANLERNKSDAKQLAKQLAEIKANPTLEAEFTAHRAAIKARFGETETFDTKERMKTRLDVQDHQRVDEILRPTRLLREAEIDVRHAARAEQAHKQGYGFTM